MKKYLLHILIISFVFILAPTVHVASCAGELEDAKELVRNNPDNAGAHFNLGVAYGANGMNKKAIKSYKQALRINPDFKEAHYNLGGGYYKSGKNEEAVESFKQAIRIDPDFAIAHYNLACCYSLLGNVSKALKSLGEAIDLGFDDIKHIENDSDLNGLRDEAGYKKLINKLKR
jgi:tetratricopeptide (TPR) repeat protein